MFAFQGYTQYRQADKCFMLNDGFDDIFSTDMDDWFKVCILYLSYLSFVPLLLIFYLITLYSLWNPF